MEEGTHEQATKRLHIHNPAGRRLWLGVWVVGGLVVLVSVAVLVQRRVVEPRFEFLRSKPPTRVDLYLENTGKWRVSAQYMPWLPWESSIAEASSELKPKGWTFRGATKHGASFVRVEERISMSSFHDANGALVLSDMGWSRPASLFDHVRFSSFGVLLLGNPARR